MQITFDWEYEPLAVKGTKKAKQYVCTDQSLVFTVFPLHEFELVAENALYLQGRNGVYMAIGSDTMYTGLSESNDGGIMARFRNHLSGKNKKDFIENVVMVTSVRENPEDFNSEIIRSLEHILYLQSIYANRLSVFNTKGKTDYKITGRRSLKLFLKVYGTVMEMLAERNIDIYTPITCQLDVIVADDVFCAKDEDGKYNAAVRVTPANKLVILKNSRFKIPSRNIFDFESYGSLFTTLIDKEHASIVYDDGEFYFTFIRDFTCTNDHKFEDISNLILDEQTKSPKKEWISGKSKTTLEKQEENKWKLPSKNSSTEKQQ
jgi:hypothetical protein